MFIQINENIAPRLPRRMNSRENMKPLRCRTCFCASAGQLFENMILSATFSPSLVRTNLTKLRSTISIGVRANELFLWWSLVPLLVSKSSRVLENLGEMKYFKPNEFVPSIGNWWSSSCFKIRFARIGTLFKDRKRTAIVWFDIFVDLGK